MIAEIFADLSIANDTAFGFADLAITKKFIMMYRFMNPAQFAVNLNQSMRAQMENQFAVSVKKKKKHAI